MNKAFNLKNRIEIGILIQELQCHGHRQTRQTYNTPILRGVLKKIKCKKKQLSWWIILRFYYFTCDVPQSDDCEE